MNLHDFVTYDPTTGILTWKPRPNRPNFNAQYANKRAGRVDYWRKSNPYETITINHKKYLVHRLVWFLYYGYWPTYTDHINGNGLDNRIENLREVTVSQNNMNAKRPSTNTTGFKGVYRSKNKQKFVAEIRANHKKYYLGTFSDIREAYSKYCEASKLHHQEYGRVS